MSANEDHASLMSSLNGAATWSRMAPANGFNEELLVALHNLAWRLRAVEKELDAAKRRIAALEARR